MGDRRMGAQVIIINPRDNVAIALPDLKIGEELSLLDGGRLTDMLCFRWQRSQ